MRPANLNTKIFLDSGDPNETREAIRLLGFLDGQTTNPTLISKNPDAAARLKRGEKFSEREILDFYKKTVREISALIPKGSVSIEVYADNLTPGVGNGSTSPYPPQAWGGSRSGERSMLEQAREFYKWISNAHIKFPSNEEGLKAAEQAVKEGIRVNMTLCFSQEQAAAVHAATLRLRSGESTPRGQVFVSPFVGRLDDIGENGMELIKNIIRMYQTPSPASPSPSSGRRGIGRTGGEGEGRSHVEVLTASVRSVEHVMEALRLESDIITMPLKMMKEWAATAKISNFQFPISNQVPNPNAQNLKPITYKQMDLSRPWRELYQEHELTVKGMEKFSEDWKKLIEF